MDRQKKIKEVLGAIYDVHKMVQSDREPVQEAFNRLRLILNSIFNFDLISLFQYDYIEKRLFLVFAKGDPYNLLDAVNFRLGKGATHWVMQKKVPCLIPNAERRSDSAKKMVNSYLGVPIIFSGYLIGVVVLGSFQPSCFGKEDKFLLEILSGYLGNLMIRNQWMPELSTEGVSA